MGAFDTLVEPTVAYCVADNAWYGAGTLEGKGCVDCAGSERFGIGVTAVAVVELEEEADDELAGAGDAAAALVVDPLLVLLEVVPVLELDDDAATPPGTPAATGSL